MFWLARNIQVFSTLKRLKNKGYRQTVVDNGDGSYRITVTFTLREDVTYDNLEFSNFDGAVDILLDNVLLIQE